MTIKEIQDQVAKEYSDSHNYPYNFWDDFEQYCLKYGCVIDYRKAWNEVCRRAQLECAKATLEKAYEQSEYSLDYEFNGDPIISIKKSSITDESNIVLIV